jgi:hypothetical protein
MSRTRRQETESEPAPCQDSITQEPTLEASLQREGGGTGRGRLRVGVAIAIGLSGVIFVIGNKTTMMKIIVDGSRTGHEVRRVQCGGVDEVGASSSVPSAQVQ